MADAEAPESYIQVTNYVVFFTSYPFGVLLGAALFALGILLGVILCIVRCCKTVCCSNSMGMNDNSSSQSNILNLEELPGESLTYKYKGIPNKKPSRKDFLKVGVAIENELSSHGYDTIEDEEDDISPYKNVTKRGAGIDDDDADIDDYDNLRDIRF